jgi:integrase
MLDAWMAERADMKPRQQIDYRRAVNRFAAWLPTANLLGSIEAADRKTAGQYVSALVAKGTHWKTANKDISALSVYWKWLGKKGYCEANVWQGQSLSKRLAKVAGKSAEKRPFTEEEVATLFCGVPVADPELRDAMYISALSGMRREEIARLTVADCAGGVFRIRDAKTDAGDRDVPIHPGLRRLVAHRSQGKAPTAYLLHELPAPRPGAAGDRSDAFGKRFTTLRRRLGVDERNGDARQANVDFHSLRRWFDRTALDAHRKGAKGYDQWVLADVMGHERGSAGLEMTMGVYAGPSPLAARKACVEAVRLPKGCPQWSAAAAPDGTPEAACSTGSQPAPWKVRRAGKAAAERP